ncbi:DUF4932 domain-containing protein [Hymenobacter sp. UV11]|uniref:DUF4932 domain-containing protein n=1 Tax=Hymenobacter sp. UV11 TaxID=1849735 RepID=UPI00105FA64E|nr:DUF4932 domain-containing protein [Hymenobacter sp. UV11]TDN38636.1 hypothetical protein A8B98_22640 [Hymenobacter sp. UV11]TFZ63550.1 DUF4932 domain-containing protein [Hymenobacter sp. UV11]
MKPLFTLLLALLTVQVLVAQPHVATAPANQLTVTAHPGIELFTIVQLLAGKYPLPNKSAYTAEVEAYFTPFANHPAVRQARRLPKVYTDLPELGYCFDNFPAVRIHYPAHTNWYALNGEDTIQTYMRLCQQFFEDSHFWAFYQRHQVDYAAWAQPVQAQLTSQGLISKLDSFYRFRTQAAHWTILLDPLNSWGAHAIMAKNLNPRYADQVVYNVGFLTNKLTASGVPTFSLGAEAIMLVWHEGSHIYTAALQQRYKADIGKLAYLLNQADPGMKHNNIDNWAHCFDENLVRGIVIALFRQYQPPKEARKQAAREVVEDFQYAGAIADVISARYLGQRTDQNFKQFFPEVLAYLARKYPTAASATQ